MDHTMRGNPHPNYRNWLNGPHGDNKIIPEKSKSELDFCIGRGMDLCLCRAGQENLMEVFIRLLETVLLETQIH